MRWICALILVLMPTFALGGLLPDGGVSAPEVAAALKDAGYPADMTQEHAGDPLIRSSTGKLEFNVAFFQCDQQLRCASLQFTAPFRRRATAPLIATWNREKRFGRAWLDGRGIAFLSMDLETSHGMTTEALKANIVRWVAVMTAFDGFVPHG